MSLNVFQNDVQLVNDRCHSFNASYDVCEEKLILRSFWDEANLDNETLEFIKKLGYSVYSIHRNYESTIIKFVPVGGSP